MVQTGMGTDEGLPTSENRDPKHTSVVCTYGRIRCSGVRRYNQVHIGRYPVPYSAVTRTVHSLRDHNKYSTGVRNVDGLSYVDTFLRT